MSTEFLLFIDGRWRKGGSGETLPVIDPATEEEVGRLAVATAADLDEAAEAARRAFAGWRQVPAFERAAIIRRAAELMRARADAIAATATAEQGKPLAEARLETLFAADVLEWAGDEGRRLYGRLVPPRNPMTRLSVQHAPIGVSAAFTPWNFPITTPARKIGGALAAGCTCILKASEETPGSAIAIARAFEDAGLPPGVLNLVFGDPAEISQTLIADSRISKISFTGAVSVGRHLGELAGRHLKRATLELGGHAPVLVFDDVDIDAVARLAVQAKFRNAGQICIAPTRFYVQESIHDAFLERMASAANALQVGDGRGAGIDMGPLANPRRLKATAHLIEDALSRGAKLRAGGERLGNRGFFHAPTVLSEVPDDALAMREEPFGPLALVRRFGRFEEAVAEANRLPFGLAAYAFTRSADRIAHLQEALEAGMIGLNHYVVAQPELPFAGVKDSGYGAESGPEGVAEYTTLKTVTQLLAPAA